jgi:hypothetical protein
MQKKSLKKSAGVLLVALLFWAAQALGLLPGSAQEGPDAPASEPREGAPREPERAPLPMPKGPPPAKAVEGSAMARQAAETIAELFRSERSGVMVEGEGTLRRVLADDKDGDRHQRILVELENGHTLLVAHNIDLAPRVPITRDDEGATLEFRGQYEWNAEGGVLHWTHHDPDGSHPGGWLRFAGKTYE